MKNTTPNWSMWRENSDGTFSDDNTTLIAEDFNKLRKIQQSNGYGIILFTIVRPEQITNPSYHNFKTIKNENND